MTMNDRTRADLTTEERDLVGNVGDLESEDFVPARPRSRSVLVSLRIERSDADQLSRIAEAGARTFSEVAREALRLYASERSPLGDTYPRQGADQARVSRRVSESSASTWTDAELLAALSRYEAESKAASMRELAWRSYVDYARRFLAWRMGDYVPRGMAAGDRPVPRTPASTTDLRHQAEQYAHDVQEAGREPPTVDTYLRHAMFFIRWLEGDFRPGARLRGLR
jgi:hypothetical protein